MPQLEYIQPRWSRAKEGAGGGCTCGRTWEGGGRCSAPARGIMATRECGPGDHSFQVFQAKKV